MLTTLLSITSAALAAVAVGLLFLKNRQPMETTNDGITGSSNWQLKGSHNHVYLPTDTQAQLVMLKEQNAHLRRQNKRLTKQNTCLLSQLTSMSSMLDAQLLRQAEKRHKVPMLRMAVKAG